MLDNKKSGIALIILGILLFSFLLIIKADIDERDEALCASLINAEDVFTCPAHTSNTLTYLILAFVASTVVFLIGIEHVMRKPVVTQKKHVEKATVTPVSVSLDEEEQRVIDLLANTDGSIYQSDIVKETEWSKVKVTRILDKLEQKGLIERKRRGMTNLVVRK